VAAEKHPDLTLRDLCPGQKGLVTGLLPEHPTLLRKLQSMGIVGGTLIEVMERAPLGDPLAVRVRGYRLALRLDEASTIMVVQV